jgi:hypothetical protein
MFKVEVILLPLASIGFCPPPVELNGRQVSEKYATYMFKVEVISLPLASIGFCPPPLDAEWPSSFGEICCLHVQGRSDFIAIGQHRVLSPSCGAEWPSSF